MLWIKERRVCSGGKNLGRNRQSNDQHSSSKGVAMIKPIYTCVAAAALLLAMAGCQKQSDAPKPVTATSGASTSGASSASSGKSVAAPPSALPPSDASIKPSAPGAPPKTSDADGPTQATPKDLNKAQESGTMPLAGQVNNHSTPATTNEKK
jgi:hypothetical protein